MSTPESEVVLEVSDSPWSWLAIYAEAFNAADRAYLRVKQLSERRSRPPTRPEAGHIEDLRERRREAYSSLVSAVMACEAQRLGES